MTNQGNIQNIGYLLKTYNKYINFILCKLFYSFQKEVTTMNYRKQLKCMI